MSRILIIDDDDSFLEAIRTHIRGAFPGITVLTCDDPLHCLAAITADLDLLLVDLEMPGLDGAKVLSYAVSKGIDRNRIIIFSGHDADYLHKRFPMGSCLGVLNKFEVKQQEVLDMILAALPGKSTDDTPCHSDRRQLHGNSDRRNAPSAHLPTRADAVIIYASRFRCTFPLLFAHTRYRALGLPFPRIALGCRLLLWLPLSQMARVLLARLDCFVRRRRCPDPFASGFARNQLLNGRVGFLT